MGGSCLVGVAGGHDRRELEARHGLDERRMERRPGEAVADEPDAERGQTRPAA
jgi:hypothetical protein